MSSFSFNPVEMSGVSVFAHQGPRIAQPSASPARSNPGQLSLQTPTGTQTTAKTLALRKMGERAAEQPAVLLTASTHPSAGDNPALAEVQRLTALLAGPLPDAQRIQYQQELFEILSATGQGSQKFGPISGPVTTVRTQDLGIPATGHLNPPSPIPPTPSAAQTTFVKGTDGFIPTNDWFQGMGGFPCQPGHPNCTGPYMIDWTGKPDGSIKFQVPTSFSEGQSPTNPWIQQNLDPGFTVGAVECGGKPEVHWQETGNMARDVSWNHGGFVMHVVQGSQFLGATYHHMTPSLTVPAGGAMTKSTPQSGIVKYSIDVDSRNYCIYGNTTLNLTYDQASGKLTASGPYSGGINMASLDKNDPHYASNVQILDAHASVQIVNAQGALLPGNQCQFAYVCQDLQSQPTANPPLVFLKAHHLADLINPKPTGLSLITLTGEMDAHEGATFVFNVPAPAKNRDLLDPLPKLSSGQDSLTLTQAQNLIADGTQNGVAQGLSRASTLLSGACLYNKTIYQQGLTLAYAQKVLEIAYPGGPIPQKCLDAMQTLFNQMKDNMGTIVRNLQRDTDYGSLVSGTDDFYDHSMFNDHIVQYGYPLYALTCMKQYADRYAPTDPFFKANIPGTGFSGQQIGDQLAADIGQTGPGSEHPLNRNLDVYNSHSWLSGIQPTGDGKNTESESEAVLGSLSVAAWLKTTQPGSMQAQVAQTRLSMEVQGLQTYFQIDTNSVYTPVSASFVKDKTTGNLPPVVSNLWDNKVTSDTWWGPQWDRQLACEFMPAGANLLDAFLNNSSPAYQKGIANFVLRNWSNFDTDNPIQSVLIPLIAKVYPEQIASHIQDVESRTVPGSGSAMDPGTSGFILTVIGDYAANLTS